MGSRTFAEALEAARRTEVAVSTWLMRRGWKILPVYDYSGLGDGKAPKLQAIPVAASLVTPDLMIARDGKSYWVEVKHKSEATWTRTRSRWETGIDARHWEHYQAVQAATGLQVWLMFVHQKEGEVRGEWIGLLNHDKRVSPKFNMGRGGVFFAWDSLRLIAPLCDVLLEYSAIERATAACP